jgi:hypothetical protein
MISASQRLHQAIVERALVLPPAPRAVQACNGRGCPPLAPRLAA